MTPICHCIAGEAQMHQFAAKLASISRPGDCLLLEGELGTGKTAFARGFIRQLGGGEVEVTSPTFTLVQTYALPAPCMIWHYDLYRLTSEVELAEIGLEEALQQGITLIEWPEIAAGILPWDALRLALCHGNGADERIITVTASAGDWQERLKILREV